jgi:hypothetical protein
MGLDGLQVSEGIALEVILFRNNNLRSRKTCPREEERDDQRRYTELHTFLLCAIYLAVFAAPMQ